jgi:hypothetical protein
MDCLIESRLLFAAKEVRQVNKAQMPKAAVGLRSLNGLLNNIFAGVIKTKGIKNIGFHR